MKTTLPTPAAQFEALPGRHDAAAPTPPPWRITLCEVTGAVWIERRTGGTKEAVCKMGPNFNDGRDLANAELILAALNSHERLIAALKRAVNHLIMDGTHCSDAPEALAEALAALAASKP